ncbi:hypothetical protein FHS27_000381 [Rhodopirellula rubra]|uniref:Uncharacterized protein n=1 Tax=Aporhodopirellula rubra TaxID=980271 RepID=A0A7W5DVU2_9BACT|nr:hypothetical protein [Aporhodopirellula rubra]
MSNRLDAVVIYGVLSGVNMEDVPAGGVSHFTQPA